jgi:hypothetical protein
MLPPSEGPYVVVSTKYPGEGIFARYPRTFPSDLGHHARLELNDASAETIIRLLDEISDQLVTDNFANFDPDSKRYWQKWRDIYLAVRDRLVGTFDNITVTIDAGVLKTEIPLSAAPNR